MDANRFLSYPQGLLEVRLSLLRKASQLVKDTQVDKAVTTGQMRSSDFSYSDLKCFVEASNRLVGHALLKVVYSHHVVGITGLNTVLGVYLLNKLHIPDVAVLALLLVSHTVIERSNETVCLQQPSEVVEC